MNLNLLNLYTTFAVASFDKQLYLNDLVGSLDWHFDRTSGLLSFGQFMHWETQLLGTQSDLDQEWLWAWANPTDGIAEELLQMACMLRDLGGEQEIPEFTTPRLSSNEFDGHTLAMVASGLCEAKKGVRLDFLEDSPYFCYDIGENLT